jgi:hypothetical protein
VEARGGAGLAEAGTIESFITEHYWGYSRRYEYEVRHPVWNVRRGNGRFEGDVEFYGREFAQALGREADSAMLADGSGVVVYRPRRISD